MKTYQCIITICTLVQPSKTKHIDNRYTAAQTRSKNNDEQRAKSNKATRDKRFTKCSPRYTVGAFN
jgi:hypothetical protein